MYTDSHCHIFSESLYPSIHSIIENCIKSHTLQVVNVECDISSIKKHLGEYKKLPQYDNFHIYHSIGVHPDHFHDPIQIGYKEEIEKMMKELYVLYTEYKSNIVAIGECGLDYYRTYHKEAQIALFESQIALAQELHLPVVIHIRDAFDDFLDIMKQYPHVQGIVHCFSGDKHLAETIMDRTSLYISISGIVTFKNATSLQEAVPYIHKERLLIETDSPYLAPDPFRGKQNEPSYVPYVAKKIGDILNISQEEIGTTTTSNAARIFKW